MIWTDKSKNSLENTKGVLFNFAFVPVLTVRTGIFLFYYIG